MRPSNPGLPAAGLRLFAAALVVAAAAGCAGAASTATPGPPTAGPTARPTNGPTAGPTTVPGATDGTAPPPPGTIETAWGTAWETLPPGFPLPPGLTPAEPGDPVDEPSSGVFVADRDVGALVDQVVAALDGAGYSIEALGGPAEDGSVAVDAAGLDPACRARVVVRPLGGLTLVSVLLGAACPWG